MADHIEKAPLPMTALLHSFRRTTERWSMAASTSNMCWLFKTENLSSSFTAFIYRKTNLHSIIICGKCNAEETAWGLRKVIDKYRSRYAYTQVCLHTQMDVFIHFSKAKPKSKAMSSFKTNFRQWQVKGQFFQIPSTREKPGVYLQFLLKSKWCVFPDTFHHSL